MIYLDNNATTATDPAVIDTLTETLRSGPANASSLHRSGQSAAAAVSGAIDRIGRSLGLRFADPGCPRLILTSGGTESNNTAVTGIAADRPLLISRIEHPSILAAATEQSAHQSTRQPADPSTRPRNRNRPVHWIDVTAAGVVDTDHLDRQLTTIGQTASTIGQTTPTVGQATPTTSSDHNVTAVVAVMAANNETGILQPIESVAEICRRHNAHLHIDATQTIGKLPTDWSALPFGSVTFAAHKFHGPPGIGGLILAPGVEVQPIVHGGGQQLQSRGGTEPVALIVAMAHALSIATDNMTQDVRHLQSLRDRFESALSAGDDSAPGPRQIFFHGRGIDRLPQTTCVSMIGADRQSMLMAMDMAGVAASSGSACSSGSSPPSHVLTAMGCPEDQIHSALRFGVSKWTTQTEVDSAAAVVLRCYRRLCRNMN